MERGFQGTGHNLASLAQVWEQLCPAEAGADLVFLQQGPVIPCGVPSWVPHTWRSQPRSPPTHTQEIRVPADSKPGHETEPLG